MLSKISLNPYEFHQLCQDDGAGAVLQFVGVVRINTKTESGELNPKAVKALFYEAHEELAVSKINEIVQEAISKFNLRKAHCAHRVGELAVGEVAIVVTTAGGHREETYEANRYIVDRVKYEAPIWKKEIFEDGTTEWGKNSGKKPDFIEK